MASYNSTTKLNKSVYVGNWFEEQRLMEETGIRYYPDPTIKNRSFTHSRCIAHTDQTDPKNYSTTLRDTLKNPYDHPEYKSNFYDKSGPRMKALESKIRNEIENNYTKTVTENMIKSRKVDYSTTNSLNFSKPGFKPTLVEKDPFIRIPTKTSDYSTDKAVTIYSEAAFSKESKIDFPTTFVGSLDPFKKSCAFSADIKNDAIAKRTETYERPKPLPTLTEFKHLNALREKLLEISKKEYESPHFIGQAIRCIINTFWKYTSGNFTDINSLKNAIQEDFGVELTSLEVEAMHSAFDENVNGTINLTELTNFFRRTPSPRRMELIEMFYSYLDPEFTQSISYDSIVSNGINDSADSSTPSYFQSFVEMMNLSAENQGSISVDDFFDFYIDVSNEVDSDKEFEDILKETWKTSEILLN